MLQQEQEGRELSTRSPFQHSKRAQCESGLLLPTFWLISTSESIRGFYCEKSAQGSTHRPEPSVLPIAQFFFAHGPFAGRHRYLYIHYIERGRDTLLHKALRLGRLAYLW